MLKCLKFNNLVYGSFMDYMERKFKIFNEFVLLLRFYQFNYGKDTVENNSEKDFFFRLWGFLSEIENWKFIVYRWIGNWKK